MDVNPPPDLGCADVAFHQERRHCVRLAFETNPTSAHSSRSNRPHVSAVYYLIHPGVSFGDFGGSKMAHVISILATECIQHGYYIWSTSYPLKPLFVELFVDSKNDAVVILKLIGPTLRKS